ncbi:arylsulfatase [Shewanella sp. GXUN23E]|uniref:arylsulfatase n=1 Tax=Shewanella sp. GXUN23E TaxID=3422498 RepID=UPI003D7EA9AA
MNKWWIPALVLAGGMSAVAYCELDKAVETPPVSRPPNVVYFLADDMGVGDVGAYGQQKIHTPHIDQLASEGMLFTRHYSGSSVCAPSRASLMTGMDMGHAAVRGNQQSKAKSAVPENLGQIPLPSETLTVAHLFQQAGYRTGAFGKWGLGAMTSSGNPFNMGFDEFYGYLDQRNAHNYFPPYLWHNEQRQLLHNPVIDVHPKPSEVQPYHAYMGPDYAPDLIFAKAQDFVRRYQHEPFFLYVPFVVPHAALQVPDEALAQYEFDEVPHQVTGGNDYTPHPRPRAARAGMISAMDAQVGQMMALLKELHLDDNTLVFFSSDNGASSAGGSDIDFFASTAGLRGEKATLYEGGIRAPMIARWPGNIKPGSESQVVSAFWDMLPTFAELLGIPAPVTIQGQSLLPALRGKEQQVHDTLYWEFHAGNPSQAVVMGDWKAIRHFTRTKGADKKHGAMVPGNIELYQLGSDPAESVDVAAQHPQLVARALAVMNQRQASSLDIWNFD